MNQYFTFLPAHKAQKKTKVRKIFNNKWIIIIVFAAFLVRFIGVPKYPVGFTQDEAGIGYDAYSILKTGRDTWGKYFPLTLRSFGDFKLPLYSYLAIPSVFIFGLNEFAVRLTGVVFGTLAVLATYLMVEKLSDNNKLSLWSALFLALSPWHLSLSRGAFEANLTTFFIPFGVYAFYKGKEDKRWMIISGLSFGLNLFSYHSARMITTIIFAALLVFKGGNSLIKKPKITVKEIIKSSKLSIITFLAFVILVVISMFSGSNSRAADVTIFNPTDGWLAMSQKRFFIITSGLSANMARLFINKPVFIFRQFVDNYLSYLSPQYFFTEGVSDWGYGMVSGIGVLYLFEIITLLAAFAAFIKEGKKINLSIIVIWILVSPLASALSKGGAAGTRAAVMMPGIQIFSAYGLVYLIKQVSKIKIRFLNETFLHVVVILTMTICFTRFAVDYIYYMPTQAAEAMQTGRDDMAEYLKDIDGNYEKIRVSRSLGVPHIWMMFYQKWDPRSTQEYSKDWLVYDDGERVSIDQYDGYKLGKYVFGNIYYENRLNEENTLFVGRPEDFPQDAQPFKIIKDSAQKPSVYIVESLK